MNPIRIFFMISLTLIGLLSNYQVAAQGLKGKFKGKAKTSMYECGHVYKPSLKDKLNPMKALQKAVGGAVTDVKRDNLKEISISVFYQAHLHPQDIMRYPTATPGWETCGDAVFLGMTNRAGLGLAETSGDVLLDGKEMPPAGMGTYFQGFSPDGRSPKAVTISSSDGDQVKLTVAPAHPLEIKSVDGKLKGEEIVLDGSKDIIIELVDGDADPQSRLHVSMISRVGTPVIYDVLVTRPKNRIVIPKEAFLNYEGSPAPFSKKNTLIVNRVNEEIHDGTPAGAIRTLSCYMDWLPITVEGDIAKGSIITAGFDTTKNTSISIDLTTTGEYNFVIKKGGPYASPPVKVINKMAVASFVVRGNLMQKKTSVSRTGTLVTTTTITKWFPNVTKESWQALADKLYADFEQEMQQTFGWEILPLAQVTSAEAYAHTKTIQDTVTKNFVEVGAGGTRRILTTASADYMKDLSISFASDFVSERLVKELEVNAVVAVTIDLDFDMESEGLDPKVSIAFFAPNVSHKTTANYFSAKAHTDARSLAEAAKYEGGAVNQLFQMIKGNRLIEEFAAALKELSQQEDAHPVYENLWKAKMN